MRASQTGFAVLLALSLAASAGAAEPAAVPTLALVGGPIIDGYEGRPIEDGIVLIAGRYADIIAVGGDVLKHIDLLQRVDLVIKNGVRIR
jgi:hypothetical protein